MITLKIIDVRKKAWSPLEKTGFLRFLEKTAVDTDCHSNIVVNRPY